MEKCWRWFGRRDRVTLDMMRQIGVTGVVTALHELHNGDIWPAEAIAEHKAYIERHSLRWSVVESLPVSEEIKYAGKNRDRLIENYIQSLENLASCGVRTVCYNFMPVIDWIRTDLKYRLPDGTATLYFNRIAFAYFDLKIIRRHGAEADYTQEELEAVERMDRTARQADRDMLIDSVILKTQGFVNGNIDSSERRPVERFRDLLELYRGVDRSVLRSNLRYFLEAVMPVCDRCGIDLCIHPDDPPFQVLGLPRIVCGADDIAWILDSVPDVHNGITLCAGSLSASPDNDVPAMASRFADRTHFVHLRSAQPLPGGDFMEASHLAGNGRLLEVIRIMERLRPDVPMRVDHGREMLDDSMVGYNPGYSFHGRMQAFAQVEGMIAAVRDEIEREMI